MRSILGISIGDPAGIGPEVTLKALRHESIYSHAIPVLMGDKCVIEKTASYLPGDNFKLLEIDSVKQAKGEYGTVEYIDLGIIGDYDYSNGEVSKLTGEASFRYVEKAITLALEKSVDGIVTAPISKEAIHLAGHNFPGHTEILAHFCGVDEFAMVLMSGKLRVVHVTTHVSMKNACDLITKERVFETIILAENTLKKMQISGRIAVAGFNPHSSENGLFGDEEENAIKPAIEEAVKRGIEVTGPVPADTVFVKALGGEYAMVVAMYHDQGHIPVKLAGFKVDEKTGKISEVKGINCTVGLPIIRTSVDHGTAFDIAGRNMADETSMVEAIEVASMMSK